MLQITKIFLLITLISSYIFAKSADAAFFTKSDNTLGGMVGNSAIFIYTDQNSISQDENFISNLKKIAQDMVCKDKDMRDIVSTLDSVIYIYLNKNGQKVAIVKIKSCDNKAH